MIERLDDWLSGRLPAEEADALEEELFALASRGELPADARFLDRAWLAGLLLFRGGTYEPSVTRAGLAHLQASGRRIEWLEIGGSGPLAAPSESAEIVVLRVPVRDPGARIVEVVGVLDGVEITTLRDLAVEPGSGEVLWCCEADRIRAGAGMKATMRLYAREGTTRRLLEELELEVGTAK